MVYTIGAKFEGGNSITYNYLTEIEGIEVNDYIVVETNTGLKIAKVAVPDSNEQATKFIVDKIDMTQYKERVAKAKAISKLKEEMSKRRQKLEELEIYELLASKDEGMKELLDKYNELLKG